MEARLQEMSVKQETFGLEIDDLLKKINQTDDDMALLRVSLTDAQTQSQSVIEGITDIETVIGTQRKDVDVIKEKLYELQMDAKDLEFRYQSLRQKLLQSYKIDLDIQDIDSLIAAPVEQAPALAEQASVQAEQPAVAAEIPPVSTEQPSVAAEQVIPPPVI